MKIKLLFLMLFTSIVNSQTQIGNDIDGAGTNYSFGTSTALSSDGSILVVGEPKNSDLFNLGGQIRVYENINNVWTLRGSAINGKADDDLFGTAVAISSDGNTIIGGAVGSDGNGTGSNAGQARIYQFINNSWTQIGADIDGETAQDAFGTSVDISTDGSVVAIGSPYSSVNGSSSGHVSIYQNSSNTWTQIGADIDGTSGSNSGTSISLSSDGAIVAIGAPNAFASNGARTGMVRVYENINSTWTQLGADIEDGAAFDGNGRSVSLSANGLILASGADRANNPGGVDEGRARMYEFVNGSWNIIGAIPGAAQDDLFGYSVSLSDDGSLVAVGAPGNDDGFGNSSGQTKLFQNQSGSWNQVGNNINGEFGVDYSGQSVSLSSNGAILAIGAPNNNNGGGTNSGQVRVYDFNFVLTTDTFSLASKTSIYPNPTSSIINVEAFTPINKIEIFSVLGKNLMSFGNTSSLDVSELKSGVYFLILTFNNNNVVTKRFIKK